MRAVVTTGTGGPEVLSLGEVEDPRPAAGEVLIDRRRDGRQPRPRCSGRAFTPARRLGHHGPECSGRIAEPARVSRAGPSGNEVCALLAGGGYAARVAVPVGQVMPIPSGVSLVEAACLPEVASTVWSNVFMTAHLQRGERFLVHGGAGGIGTMAIRASPQPGAPRSSRPPVRRTGLEFCRSLGASHAIDYRDEDFVEVLEEAGGVDVILDNMGAKYLRRNVTALATGGRLVIIGMQGGTKGEPRHQRPAAQARVGHRDLAAGQAPGREGRDLLRRRRERLLPSPPAPSGRSWRPRCRARGGRPRPRA